MADLFELAKQSQSQGQWETAASLYREVLEADPHDFRAHNNLAMVLESQGLLDEAIESYERAAELTCEHEIVHYNLGRALHRRGRLVEAVAAYVRAAQIAPDSVETQFNLGCALLAQSRYESAAAAFRRVLDLQPALPAAWRHLGDAQFEMRWLDQALASYQAAAELEPGSAANFFDVGKVHALLRDSDRAVRAFRQSLNIDPSANLVYEHLARAILASGKRDELDDVFDEWLAARPGDQVALYLRAAMTGQDPPGRAPNGYIRDTFNAFANDFDSVMHRLSYQAPQLVHSKLRDLYGEETQSLAVLDAGCGTGLCGPLLRPFARELVGIDLSEGMLNLAAARNVYDGLIPFELTAHLLEHSARYDLIVAVDTLNYFGELQQVFSAARNALRPNGCFLFTLEHVELEPDAGFELQPHGRYSHSESYVRSTAHGVLKLTDLNRVVLRREGGTPVEGLLVTMHGLVGRPNEEKSTVRT